MVDKLVTFKLAMGKYILHARQNTVLFAQEVVHRRQIQSLSCMYKIFKLQVRCLD